MSKKTQSPKQYLQTAARIEAEFKDNPAMLKTAQELKALAVQLEEARKVQRASKDMPFTPDKIEVVHFDGGVVIGSGYRKLSPALWIKYLSNPDTLQRILELSHAAINGTNNQGTDVA